MADIELRGVTKHFGKTAALQELDLTVPDGQFFVLLGRTGAGKTTTLRTVAGLEQPDAGEVLIDGVNVTGWGAAERDIALVLQQYSLYPRYTVRENLEFPLKSRIRRTPRATIDQRVARVAEILRIGHLLERATNRLSGGEMQRVSVGRAIVRNPQVFLMDEPLAALDAKLREMLRVELKDLQTRLGETFLFVTHDQVEAMSMGDRIGVLRAGRLVQTGRPYDIYNRPVNTFVARAVGSPAVNLLEGSVENDRAVVEGEGLEMPFPDGAHGSERLVFGIRPEDIAIESGAPAAAVVQDVENLGAEKTVTLRAENTLVRATVPPRIRLAIDEPVRFTWDPAKVMVFDQESGRNLRLGT